MDEDKMCKADVSKVMRQFLLRSSSLSEEDIGINKQRKGNDDMDGGDLEVDGGMYIVFGIIALSKWTEA